MGSNNFVYCFNIKIFRGPPDTPYEGGYFCCILKYPNDYPLNPVLHFMSCQLIANLVF